MSNLNSIMNERGVSEDCAMDIAYLRSRFRHTPDLENELIDLHRNGTPPNMSDFGVTPETQRALIEEVVRSLGRDEESAQ